MFTRETLQNTKQIKVGGLKVKKEWYEQFPLTVELFLSLANGNDEKAQELMRKEELLKEGIKLKELQKEVD